MEESLKSGEKKKKKKKRRSKGGVLIEQVLEGIAPFREWKIALGLRYIPSYFLRSRRWRPVMDVENSITRDLWLPTVGYIYCRSISFWPLPSPSPGSRGNVRYLISVANTRSPFLLLSDSSRIFSKKKRRRRKQSRSFPLTRFRVTKRKRLKRRGTQGLRIIRVTDSRGINGGQTGVL